VLLDLPRVKTSSERVLISIFHKTKMNKAHLYRLLQLNEIEQEFHEEKIKHTTLIQKYHSVTNFVIFVYSLFSIVWFCSILFFLSNFQEM